MQLYLYYALGFIAISCYASLSTFAKKTFQDIPHFSFISVTMLLLAIFSFIASRVYEKNFSFTNLPASTWGWMGLFAFVNFLGFATYLYVISKINIIEYQIIGLVTPLVGGFIAFLLLNEPLTLRYVAGVVIASIGIAIALKK